MSSDRVSIAYFSDVLCIWAYVAQIKIDELRRNFPDRVAISNRFVSIFGSTAAKIGERWSERGGFPAYAAHVREVAARFPHVEVHSGIWTESVPAGSWSPHLFVKAAALAAVDGEIDDASVAAFDGRTAVEELTWRLRLAFFRDQRNIAHRDVQLDVARSLDLPFDDIGRRIDDGAALAALAEDHDAAAAHRISGSPTFLLNEGRQKLYGNVGYRIIEANVQELLRDDRDVASWC